MQQGGVVRKRRARPHQLGIGVEQLTQTGELAPLDRVGSCLEAGVDRIMGVLGEGRPVPPRSVVGLNLLADAGGLGE